MGERDADAIYDYRGLFWRSPYLESILTAMLLSLAGIPLTAGLIGTFYIIPAGVDPHMWLMLAGAVPVRQSAGAGTCVSVRLRLVGHRILHHDTCISLHSFPT